MKKLILITLLIATINTAHSQTTIPVKNKLFIELITGTRTKYQTGHHYDFYFTGIGLTKIDIWVNKYKGKWYSNWPYTVKSNENYYKIYKHKKLFYIVEKSNLKNPSKFN